jgi:hypothetical protein
MTAQSSIPLKWYVPFAQGDSSRVELPVTTADPTRASQTLGFPPLTMQPPESGGVPPQGEDFNGGLNQVARIAWWVLNGGGWPYDSTFATNSNINGYPNGAKLQSADFKGDWLSTTDNNQANPDTNGAGWVPGFQYGTTALSGLTGGTVTPTPAQAAKGSITLAGTLTSALTVIVPAWVKNWTITNNTGGAFVTIVKTAAGSGVTIPQNSAPTRVSGDGTNIVQSAENVALATTTTNALQFQQLTGIIGTSRGVSANQTTAAAALLVAITEVQMQTALGQNGALKYTTGSFSLTLNVANTGVNGMDFAGAPASGFVGVYAIFNPTTFTTALLGVNAGTGALPEIYANGGMPAGYTASALLFVVPTTAASLIDVCTVRDRRTNIAAKQIFSTSSAVSTPTITNNLAVPPNAKRCSGFMQVGNTAASSVNITLYANISSVGPKVLASTLNASSIAAPFENLELTVAQRTYYTGTTSGGTATFAATCSSWEI